MSVEANKIDANHDDPVTSPKPLSCRRRLLQKRQSSGKTLLWMNSWLGLVCWMGLLYGTMSLANVRNSLSGALCGPWGCTAPLEAVVACHLGWFALFSPLGVWLLWHGTRQQRWIVGIVLLLFSLAVILALCAISLQESFTIPGAEKYIPHRMGLKLIGCVDLPLFAALAWGAWCLLTSRKQFSAAADKQVLSS